MLQNFRENERLNETVVLLASILNSTVVPIRETFTYHLPVILPMLFTSEQFTYQTLWLGTLVLLLFVVVAVPKKIIFIFFFDRK